MSVRLGRDPQIKMKNSKIQWCDDTENPVMGCDGCELWPTVGQVLAALISLVLRFTKLSRNEVRAVIAPIINEYETTTELWHDRELILIDLQQEFPDMPASDWERTIEKQFKCYAGTLHLARGGRPDDWSEPVSPGHAAIFERPVNYPGRMAKTAKRPDLRGEVRADKPWLNGLPRLVFVSDMGDALSEGIDFDYLKDEIIDVATGPDGSRHLWLWLTKRPKRMAEFAEWLRETHGVPWPDNLVAMTSVTNRTTRSRIDQLRKVPARFRGLSVEPLVESVDLDLTHVDWLIVGGESGKYSREFDIEWARSLKEQCSEANVAFFVKQLGANAVEDGFPVELRDSHGGDWNEWPVDLRDREFPSGFGRCPHKTTQVA